MTKQYITLTEQFPMDKVWFTVDEEISSEILAYPMKPKGLICYEN